MPTLDGNLVYYAQMLHDGTSNMFGYIWTNAVGCSYNPFLWPANLQSFVQFVNSFQDNSAAAWNDDMKGLLVKSAAYAFFRQAHRALYLSTRHEGHIFNTLRAQGSYAPRGGWYKFYVDLFFNLHQVLSDLMQGYS